MPRNIHHCPACDRNFEGDGNPSVCPNCGERDVRATYYVLDFQPAEPTFTEVVQRPLMEGFDEFFARHD